MKYRLFSPLMIVFSVFLLLALLLLAPAKAQTPATSPGEAIPPPTKPLLAWPIAADGAVYVLDAANSLYHLNPTDLTPLAKSAPLFDTKFEQDQPYLQVDRDYLFVANPLLTQTLVLSRNDFSPLTTLAWAGPMALDPDRRLLMISPDPRFYHPDRSPMEERPGVFAFDLTHLDQLPEVIVKPVQDQYGSSPNHLIVDAPRRRLYIGSWGCCANGSIYTNYGRYNLDTFEGLGGLISGSNLPEPSVAKKTGLVVAISHTPSGPLSDELLLFDAQGQEIKRQHLLYGRVALTDAAGEWLYVLRQHDVWVLRSDDLGLQRIYPLPEGDWRIILSPDGQTLYLADFSTGQMLALPTAELQRQGRVPLNPFPQARFCADCSEFNQAHLYLSPQVDQDGLAFILLPYGELYRTADKGLSWLYLPASIYPDFKFLNTLWLSPDFATDQTLVAKSQSDIFYRSINRGETWEEWSPPIAFVTDRDGNREIYTMNQAGAALKRLTFDPAADENPAWSPAWTRLTFQSHRTGNWDIFSMRLDCDPRQPEAETQCDLRQLTDSSADEILPAWSPDGRSIAYVSIQDGNPEIYVMDLAVCRREIFFSHENNVKLRAIISELQTS